MKTTSPFDRTRTPALFGVVVALVCAAIGVGCSVEPPSGTKTPKFSDINEQILKPQCTFACHSGGEFAAGGLDLEVDPWGALVDAPPTAAVCKGNSMKRVARGNPDDSLLYEKVIAKADGAEPACGQSMPPGADLSPLSDDDANRIRAWIAAGANDD